MEQLEAFFEHHKQFNLNYRHLLEMNKKYHLSETNLLAKVDSLEKQVVVLKNDKQVLEEKMLKKELQISKYKAKESIKTESNDMLIEAQKTIAALQSELGNKNIEIRKLNDHNQHLVSESKARTEQILENAAQEGSMVAKIQELEEKLANTDGPGYVKALPVIIDADSLPMDIEGIQRANYMCKDIPAMLESFKNRNRCKFLEAEFRLVNTVQSELRDIISKVDATEDCLKIGDKDLSYGSLLDFKMAMITTAKKLNNFQDRFCNYGAAKAKFLVFKNLAHDSCLASLHYKTIGPVH